MASPFDSAHRKITWASEHFTKLEREVVGFLAKDPYRETVEIDPNNPKQRLHKFKLTDNLDKTFIPEIVGDVASNLRAALDHAVYAVAKARRAKPRYAYFPFSGSDTDFEDKLKGYCKDVPPEMYPLFRSFKPYKGGNQRPRRTERAAKCRQSCRRDPIWNQFPSTTHKRQRNRVREHDRPRTLLLGPR